MKPVQLKISRDKLLIINWENGEESSIKLTNLRLKCPCADCKTERNEQSSSYVPIFSDNEVTIKNMKLTGNYAVSIEWKDGHNTGIYEFTYLYKISNKIISD